MPLPTGARFGAYAVLSPLGAGGMGEVYRASDTRLDRVVALKILRREVSDHPARRQRFEREARAVASLSHPHICTLHDVGEADGALFLVMEYLEGETLAQRLRRGALPMQDVLRYAIEIADALDHAHREGIVHRDLKPANIMLTRSGTKLLDFGLAKALARAEETGSGLRAMSASAGAASLAETEPLTEEGTILGTVHYMAPEQLEARETDARTDIFAFGAVLYEMLSGRKAFEGGSKASVIAAVLEHDPPPLDLRATDVTGSGPVAPLLDHVIARCLAKSPDERWQSAGDLMRELQWIAGSGTHLGLPARTSAQGSRRGRLVAASLIGLTSVAAIVAVVGIWRPASTDERAVQFVVGPPEGSAFNPAPAFMAVSPDGRHLAFSAANRGAGMALWLRSLDSLDLRQLTTEEGAQPFWSPDSRIVAFYARAEYKRMDIRTGRVQTLINARGQSGTWSRAGEIVMKLADRPVLSRFSVDGGGPPIPATTLDVARDEVLHTWPQFLPDGRRFLYVARSARPEYDKTICVGSLDSNSRTVLFKADSHAAYAAGYLLYMRGSTLTAQPFDATNLRATGEPVPVADRVESSAFGNRGSFSISDTDVLAYRGIGDTRLLWLDRAGRVLATIGPPGNYANPALSPDGRRAAVARLDPEAGAPDIWLIELARGALSRFTFTSSSEDMPLWSPDGGRIVFRATRTPGMAGFYDKASSGTGSDELVLDGLSAFVNPLGWSRKGGALVYGSQSDKTLTDLWELRRGDRTSVALVQSEFHEIQGQPSPDGQWIAYVSNESGRYEVYVRSLTGEGKWPVSAAGGLEPKWRADGKELFYLAPDRSLMSVTLQSGGSALGVGTPTRLFETRLSTIPNSSFTRNQYDVTPDGQHFLINQPSGDASATPITVVVNWPAALNK